MKKWILLSVLGTMCLASWSCTPPEAPWSTDKDPVAHRLRAWKDAYFEYEPMEFVLVTQNNTPEPKSLAMQDRGGYLYVHEITDNDEVLWKPIPVDQDVTGQQIMPGETVDLRVADSSGRAVLTKPGTWIVTYRFFQETGARKKLLFSTPDLFIRCEAQPLYLPAGTPAEVADALKALVDAPAHDYISRSPSWTRLTTSDPMRRLEALGEKAGPALLANLNHFRIRPAVIQVLARMRYRPAFPVLLAMLKMNESLQDRLLVTALCDITGVPGASDLYSRWETLEGKEDALAAFRAWYSQSK